MSQESIVPNAISPASARAAQRGVPLEEPGDLAAREVGVEDEAGALVEDGLVPLGLQPGADLGRLAALPDDRAVDGVARLRGPRGPSSRAGW